MNWAVNRILRQKTWTDRLLHFHREDTHMHTTHSNQNQGRSTIRISSWYETWARYSFTSFSFQANYFWCFLIFVTSWRSVQQWKSQRFAKKWPIRNLLSILTLKNNQNCLLDLDRGSYGLAGAGMIIFQRQRTHTLMIKYLPGYRRNGVILEDEIRYTGTRFGSTFQLMHNSQR